MKRISIKMTIHIFSAILFLISVSGCQKVAEKTKGSEDSAVIFLKLILLERNNYGVEQYKVKNKVSYPSNFSEFIPKDYGRTQGIGDIYFNADGSIDYRGYNFVYNYDEVNDTFMLSAKPTFEGGRYFATGKSPQGDKIVIVDDINKNGKVDIDEPIIQ